MTFLEELQHTSLDLATVVIDLCEKHGIRYYLAEGTMLGAVRHKGFIPWDEDIDLAIPRADYNRLLPILKAELPEGYRLVHYPDATHHPRYFAQVERLNMPVCEDNFVVPFERHMWIDLFPIDGMPKTAIGRKWHLWHLLYLRVTAQLADADECINDKGRHKTIRRLSIALGNIWTKTFRIDPRKRLAKMEKAAQKYDAAKTGYTISLGSLYKGRTIFPTAYYGEGRECDFEGRRWRLPTECEKMLSSLYGDYMTPPPEDKRIGHNLKPMTAEHIR